MLKCFLLILRAGSKECTPRCIAPGGSAHLVNRWVQPQLCSAHLSAAPLLCPSLPVLPAAEAILGSGTAVEYERQRYARALQAAGAAGVAAAEGGTANSIREPEHAAAAAVKEAMPITAAWLRQTLVEVRRPAACQMYALAPGAAALTTRPQHNWLPCPWGRPQPGLPVPLPVARGTRSCALPGTCAFQHSTACLAPCWTQRAASVLPGPRRQRRPRPPAPSTQTPPTLGRVWLPACCCCCSARGQSAPWTAQARPPGPLSEAVTAGATLGGAASLRGLEVFQHTQHWAGPGARQAQVPVLSRGQPLAARMMCTSAPVPSAETLLLDLPAIVALQNELQRLSLLAASLLIVRQVQRRRSAVPPAGLAAAGGILRLVHQCCPSAPA